MLWFLNFICFDREILYLGDFVLRLRIGLNKLLFVLGGG